jgi:hypothetical protein
MPRSKPRRLRPFAKCTLVALERLLEIAQTAGDPRLRRQASALLTKMVGRLCESGLNVSREH